MQHTHPSCKRNETISRLTPSTRCTGHWALLDCDIKAPSTSIDRTQNLTHHATVRIFRRVVHAVHARFSRASSYVVHSSCASYPRSRSEILHRMFHDCSMLSAEIRVSTVYGRSCSAIDKPHTSHVTRHTPHDYVLCINLCIKLLYLWYCSLLQNEPNNKLLFKFRVVGRQNKSLLPVLKAEETKKLLGGHYQSRECRKGERVFWFSSFFIKCLLLVCSLRL